MDGVPFMISEKFACASSEVSGPLVREPPRVRTPRLTSVCGSLCVQLHQVDLMGITIKSLAEIEKEVSIFTRAGVRGHCSHSPAFSNFVYNHC